MNTDGLINDAACHMHFASIHISVFRLPGYAVCLKRTSRALVLLEYLFAIAPNIRQQWLAGKLTRWLLSIKQKMVQLKRYFIVLLQFKLVYALGGHASVQWHTSDQHACNLLEFTLMFKSNRTSVCLPIFYFTFKRL